jgi:hypothetical protein
MHCRKKILARLANSAARKTVSKHSDGNEGARMPCRVLDMHTADHLNLQCNAGRCVGWYGRRATNGEAIAQACRWGGFSSAGGGWCNVKES